MGYVLALFSVGMNFRSGETSLFWQCPNHYSVATFDHPPTPLDRYLDLGRVTLICDPRRIEEKKKKNAQTQGVPYTKRRNWNIAQQLLCSRRKCLFVFILRQNWVIQLPNTSLCKHVLIYTSYYCSFNTQNQNMNFHDVFRNQPMIDQACVLVAERLVLAVALLRNMFSVLSVH